MDMFLQQDYTVNGKGKEDGHFCESNSLVQSKTGLGVGGKEKMHPKRNFHGILL